MSGENETIDLDKVLTALTALGDAFSAHTAKVDARLEDIEKRCDAVLKSRDVGGRMDGGDDRVMAERVAADAVGHGEFAALASRVGQLHDRMYRKTDVDKLAETQSRCDSVFRALGGPAEPPMNGENHVDYEIRLHRQLQKHSARWKGADLRSLSNDQQVLSNVCADIRADALQAGLNPPDLKPFEHRMITEHLPTGHLLRRFVGNGTIYAQMARRPMRVRSFGADDRYGRSAGGSVYAHGASGPA
ncbi:hypothetical protein ACVIHI_002577 [Bradyrhizobium sp. USDA 4524]|uniref:hypothetical protein n=1 Tax=unclassified Bradyrhizobium TaxID=2631580 RepID=UPI0020A20D62|nr:MULTISPECIES: hypothetical protein [unclassified Bradyrhizobium]MCP1844501.1 hypothetical protein [Bradyrhizobium sp. USDA 4538]MCP1905067.1 hypothetical protein [Bradyrhizobium sp. USDA 4537]MCP1989277.1 hypothetical protein [Bradyrhizobium sp. USDA 4539]